ncbi:MAG: hypothetical protein MUF54_01805 [Polyangiaceae bacterium]|jgi:hypothetical protein|nr:hypothetical protein [Polyangiaceae bacterium]
MQLPGKTAHYAHRIQFGRYLARRCRQAHFGSLADAVHQASQAVLVAGRAVEDADGPAQDAMADRDGFDDHADFAAQEARANLAGRSVDASRTEPYTLIFHKGIGYYTAAPLDQSADRYAELVKRLEANLPENDPVRVSAIPTITDSVKGFVQAGESLQAARTEAGIKATALASAEEAWERLIEKTYGALVAEVGRTRAECFFPRKRAGRSKNGSDGPSEEGG